MSGTVFPTQTPDIVIDRNSRVFVDNNTLNGDAPISAILALLILDDMFSKLMLARPIIEDVPASVTSYTVVAADQNKIKKFLSSAACAVLLPAGMPPGWSFQWIQVGAGFLTFQSAAGAGQTVKNPDGLRSAGMDHRGFVEVTGTNTWSLSGGTQA